MTIFDIWYSKEGNPTEKMQHVLDTLTETSCLSDDIENIDLETLSTKIKNVCKRISHYWAKSNRTRSKLLEKYSDWLNVTENIDVERIELRVSQHSDEVQPSTSRGRSKLNFEEASKRTKRRRLASLSNQDPSLVRSLLDDSHSSSFPKIDSSEVLSLIVEAQLTRHQYLLFKKFIDDKVSKGILPSYQSIVESKKHCYPSDIKVTESSAEVELQSLLDHTANRILQSQKDVLDRVPNESLDKISLVGKWGFDGSTGHSEYKQCFSDPTLEDSSLFVTSYVPLQLIMKSDNEENSVVLWKNPRPSSTRYCRPIRFRYLKETAEVSVGEEAYFKEKMSNMQPTVFKEKDREYRITHCLQLTMVDGKVCNALSNVSSSKCYICNALPSEMNKIDKCLNKEVDESKYEFGLSPLHALIRFFEYFIHVAYKLDVKKWQARSANDQMLVSAKKKYVQTQFRERLGLIVDKPKSGGSGTSNDGNTARRFFSNSEVSSEITGIKKDLLDRCWVILQCLNLVYKINKTKFQEFALETARQLVAEYPWYYMPASVHKVLLHGVNVIDHALLSIGELSEEAAEATNKYIKSFRRDHTRKMSRTLTNTDLINRLLLHSDPFITGLRKLPVKKKDVLSKPVLDLLCI